MENSDVIANLHGCSVPVVRRPTYPVTGVHEYLSVNEAYIYGKMDGEALDDNYIEQDFKLI
jgi:hypothetical protein